MLFALDWIKRAWSAIFSDILALTEGLNLFSVSAAINSSALIMIACLTAGLTLSLYGFRYHKLVNGFAGGILFGTLGWNMGLLINENQITIAAIYMVILAILGFFLLYLCYFFQILTGGWFLFLAVLDPFRAALQEYLLLAAFLLAVLYCAFYIKYKLPMTAVTGAILLGLAMLCHTPGGAALIACGCIAAGIYVQLELRRRYEKKIEQAMQEQYEKYPYGPGLVYGWPDPTLSHSSEKKG